MHDCHITVCSKGRHSISSTCMRLHCRHDLVHCVPFNSKDPYADPENFSRGVEGRIVFARGRERVRGIFAIILTCKFNNPPRPLFRSAHGIKPKRKRWKSRISFPIDILVIENFNTSMKNLGIKINSEIYNYNIKVQKKK